MHVSGHLARLAGLKLAPDGATPPWVWYDEDKKLPNGKLSPAVPAVKRYFRKAFTLPSAPADAAVLALGGDDGFTVWLNGRRVGQSVTPHFSQRVYAFDVAKLLKPGPNLLAVEVTNQLEPLLPGIATAAGSPLEMSRVARVSSRSGRATRLASTIARPSANASAAARLIPSRSVIARTGWSALESGCTTRIVQAGRAPGTRE